MVNLRFILAFTVALALSGQQIVANPILVDNFEAPVSPGQSVTTGSLNGNFAATTSAGNILGTRNLTYSGTNAFSVPLNTFDNGEGIWLNANANSAGKLQVATSSSALELDLNYSGFGSVDLSAMNSLDLSFIPLFDGGVGGGFTIDLLLTTSPGNTFARTYIVPPAFSPVAGTLQLLLSGFTVAGTPSLSNITEINLEINASGNRAADYKLENLQFTPIPEPATLALFGGAGLFAFYVARRKRKQAEPV